MLMAEFEDSTNENEKQGVEERAPELARLTLQVTHATGSRLRR